jgi:predicted HTH domain antitoxin
MLPEKVIELKISHVIFHPMNAIVNLDISADALASARMSLEDLRLELAILLFQMDRLSLGKAAEFAFLPVGVFQSHLASRKLGPHYDVADALEDAAALASLSR